MSHRILPGLVLPQTPLIFVLAQVRTSPVLTIGEKIPAIQEALRKNGFPRLDQRNIQVTRQETSGTVQFTQRPQWVFTNRENTLCILVESESIVLQSTNYSVFEEFLQPLKLALETVAEIAAPSLVERIGLRYIDLILPSEGKDLAYYLEDALRVSPWHGCGARTAMFSESIFTTENDTQLMIRFVEGNQGLAFPPDLLPVSLHFRKNPARTTPFGLLDLDHSSETPLDYNPSSIIEGMWNLHSLLETVFKSSVTPDAISEWSKS